MKKKMKSEIKATEKKGHKIRKSITLLFFGIVLIFMLSAFFTAGVAIQSGVSARWIMNPGTTILMIAMLCFLLSTVSYYFLSKRVFAPLEEFNKASKQVASGDFSVQLGYQGDIEELRVTMDNFNRMVKELNSVEIMRNDFIADVSHEFKTPLAAITGYATFLQDPELSQEEKQEYIRKIFFNIDKLNDLTENILRLSKLEHQQFMEDPVSFRLDEQIREAIVLLEPKWGRKQIEFELELPEVVFRGYPSLLFQVWTNLIGNAIKYTDQDGKIAVYLKETDHHVKVIVSDDGIGMDENTLNHIFDKFYQGDTSRKSQGNGLGLPLCQEIVQKCGGKIHVESTPGVGSVFLVNLNKN